MKASCNVVLDLIPLVKDHVASADSIELVMGHVENCESCKLEFESYVLPMKKAINDEKVLLSIKKRLFLLMSALLLAGSVIGMGFTRGAALNLIPLIISLGSIGFVGLLMFKFDLKGGIGVRRFFVGKAIGTVILFALIGIYLLVKFVLGLF